MNQQILVPISPGELVDKITILEIKNERIRDEGKLKNVKMELDLLERVQRENIPATEDMNALKARLRSINETLWVIEDEIRDCERAKNFGEIFIALARKVYYTNDDRAAVKRDINIVLGSQIVEEKSYASYSDDGGE